MKQPNGNLRHILRADQFDRAALDQICHLTDAIRQFAKTKEGLLYLQGLLSHRRGMLYFTQPSTRTFLSFLSACQILGIQASEIRDSNTSSERKGETIEDSLRTFSSYVDLIIMRTPVAGLCDRIAATLDESPRSVPVINAGSGPDQHPTQSVLDIYTLAKGFKGHDGIDGKTIVMVGDLKRGRTIRSLAMLLSNYKNVRLLFVSPPEYRITDDLGAQLRGRKQAFEETADFIGAISSADAIYMTRVQDEYDANNESKSVDYSKFHLKFEHLRHLKKDCQILHPLPRRQELDTAIDKDPRAIYWRQERNGMWTRVALITQLMGVDHQILLPDL